MTRMPLSVQLYTLRNDLAADPDATLGRVAAIGLTAVEPYGLAESVDLLAGPLARHGLSAPTAHAGLVDGDLDVVLAAADRLGTRLVIEPFIPVEQWTSRDDIARLADRLNAAAARFAPHGLEVGYHNHAWELEQRLDDQPVLLTLVGYLDDAVRIELDTYWAAVGGSDPVALLEELGARVAAIHVKDGPISHDTHAQLPAGEGAMPLAGVLAAAPQARRILEFDEYSGDLYEGLALGKANVERIESAA